MFKKVGFVTAWVCGICLSGMGHGRAYGAAITWGPAMDISGDSDVTTAGSLVTALNFGATGVPSVTVNGVLFGAFPVPNGGVIFSSNTAFGSSSTPFSSLSSDYQTLLKSGFAASGEFQLNLQGLTVGQTYLFEWWSNDAALALPVIQRLQRAWVQRVP